MTHFTRRQLAKYGAAELLAGHASVVDELARYLVSTKRTKEVEMLVRDIESALAESGVVVADVASAHELDAEKQAEVRTMLEKRFGAAEIQLRQTVDSTLLGGVMIQTPDEVFDGSVKRSINQLKAMKV